MAQWECKHDKTSFAWSQQSSPGIPAGESTIQILKGIDLTIYEGELVAIVGQSGSGKSTLMNILGCLDRPTSGSYKVNGQETGKLWARSAGPDYAVNILVLFSNAIIYLVTYLLRVTLKFQLFMQVLHLLSVNNAQRLYWLN